MHRMTRREPSISSFHIWWDPRSVVEHVDDDRLNPGWKGETPSVPGPERLPKGPPPDTPAGGDWSALAGGLV